jgi:hypothetical protein
MLGVTPLRRMGERVATDARKRKIESVVYDPQTNEIGIYEQKKLRFFDSESQFAI